jgi:guanyl-specific ribonuclease Sa
LARGHRELTADDLTALGVHQVYASLSASGASTPYAALSTAPPPRRISDPTAIRRRSRAVYGRRLDQIERELLDLIARGSPSADTAATSTGRRRRPS